MRLLETNRVWILYSLFVSVAAVLFHIFGQTSGSMNLRDYFKNAPNYYATWPNTQTPRFDQLSHPLSSHALAALVQNLNLPGYFYIKDLVVFVLSGFWTIIWEAGEYILWLLLGATLGWFNIDFVDMLFDIKNNTLGTIVAMYFYHKIVLAGVD